MTDSSPPAVGLEDPRVQARVEELAAQHQSEVARRSRAAFAVPRTIGPWTFHVPNACTLDAVCQPPVLQLSQVRLRIILGYLLTLEPADQIPAAADATALRVAAAQWEESIPAEHLPEIIKTINHAWDWLQERLTRDSAFFFAR